MKVGLYMNTHGIGATIGGQWTLQPLAASEMALVETCRRAEQAGYDSLWFSDHVLMAPSPASRHNAADPETGARAYSDSPDMIDAVVGMSVAAAVTDRVRVAPSVWISPYRHPLQDVRQFTSIDAVSGGRLLVAVGVGWMQEEFAALNVPYEERVSRLEESVAVYKACWEQEWIDHTGDHFDFRDIRMDPKPQRAPRPPIYYGGVTRAAARIAARCCDGFYPTFVDPDARPDRYRSMLAGVPELLGCQGRRPEDFALLAVVSARLERGRNDADRGLAKGSIDKVLSDFEALATEGFSMVVLHLDSNDGSYDEWQRQLDLVGEHLIPQVGAIAHHGPWAQA